MTVLASAYPGGSAALAAPAATRAGTLARIRPGGPMTAPGNRPPAPRAFSGNTVSLVSGNWGGYAAQWPGVKFCYARAAFFVPYVDCASSPSSFSGHWAGGTVPGQPTQVFRGTALDCYWMATG